MAGRPARFRAHDRRPSWIQALAGLTLAGLALVGCGGSGGGARAPAGSPAPDFSATTLTGEEFKLSDLRGNVIWLNFFATWCGPCMTEMPRLQREVWDRFADDDFVLVAVGREHSPEELQSFQRRSNYGFFLVPDPERRIYSLYAANTIPRNYIIDAQGRIVHQSVGYADHDFRAMVALVEQLLAQESS